MEWNQLKWDQYELGTSWALTQNARESHTVAVQFAAVELQADDGEHEDCEEEQQANLQQRHHGLHDGLQHDLQAWHTHMQTGISTKHRAVGWHSRWTLLFDP